MANGDDDPLNIGVDIATSRDDLRRAAQNRNNLVAFVPPTPDDLDTERFRTQESEEISGLIQDLASARVDAAREAQQIREQATRQAQANLFSTVGAQGLTQAITGFDMGAPEQAQQAQQTLRQAREAEREAETQAEQTEATAPVQADVQSQRIIQQDKQQAQEKAQVQRQQEIERNSAAADRISEAAARNVDAELQKDLAQQEHGYRMEEIDRRLEGQMDQLRTRLGMEALMSGEEQSETQETLSSSIATFEMAKQQIDRMFEQLQTNEGWYSDSQTVPNDALRSVQGSRTVLSRMITGAGDTPNLINAKSKLEQAGVWNKLPEEQRQKFDRIIGITQALGSIPEEENVSQYADELRNLGDRYEGIQEFSPMGVIQTDTLEDVVRRDDNTDDNPQGGGSNNTGGRGGNSYNNWEDRIGSPGTSSYQTDFTSQPQETLSDVSQPQTPPTTSQEASSGPSDPTQSTQTTETQESESQQEPADMTVGDLVDIHDRQGITTGIESATRGWLEDRGIDPENINLRVRTPSGDVAEIDNMQDLANLAMNTGRAAAQDELEQAVMDELTDFSVNFSTGGDNSN